jgi:hypothetical protein
VCEPPTSDQAARRPLSIHKHPDNIREESPMIFEKIRQYNRPPSFADAVAAMRRERAAHEVDAVGLAFEEAERVHEMQQPQPDPVTVTVVKRSTPAEIPRPLVGLADSVVSVDDQEEEALEIVGPFAGDDEEFTDDDEEIRYEAAADAALEEEEEEEEEDECRETNYATCKDGSSDDHASNIEA